MRDGGRVVADDDAGDSLSLCLSVSREGADLRLSLAVDSFIYFANIRHYYSWTYFLNTVVYSYPVKQDKRETAVVFWEIGRAHV